MFCFVTNTVMSTINKFKIASGNKNIDDKMIIFRKSCYSLRLEIKRLVNQSYKKHLNVSHNLSPFGKSKLKTVA